MSATAETNSMAAIEMLDAEQSLDADLLELSRRYPPPSLDDVRADFAWFHDRCERNTLDPEGKYDGLNIAIYHCEIVGADLDYRRLQRDLARKFGVHPERIVIKSQGTWNW